MGSAFLFRFSGTLTRCFSLSVSLFLWRTVFETGGYNTSIAQTIHDAERSRHLIQALHATLMLVGVALIGIGIWAGTAYENPSPALIDLAVSHGLTARAYTVLLCMAGVSILAMGTLGAFLLSESMAGGFIMDGRGSTLVGYQAMAVTALGVLMVLIFSAAKGLNDLSTQRSLPGRASTQLLLVTVTSVSGVALLCTTLSIVVGSAASWAGTRARLRAI